MACAAVVFEPASVKVDAITQTTLPVGLALGKLGLAVVILGVFAATFGAALETGLSSGYTIAQYFGWEWGKRVAPRRAARFHTVVLVSVVLGAALLLTTIDPQAHGGPVGLQELRPSHDPRTAFEHTGEEGGRQDSHHDAKSVHYGGVHSGFRPSGCFQRFLRGNGAGSSSCRHGFGLPVIGGRKSVSATDHPDRDYPVGMLRLGFPVIGVSDLPRAVAFWTAALNLVASDEWAREDWRTLVHPDGSGRVLGLMSSGSPIEPYPRIHLDLLVDTAAEQEAEVARLKELGARDVGWDRYPPKPDFVVLADPDGNRFCVVDLSNAPSGG